MPKLNHRAALPTGTSRPIRFEKEIHMATQAQIAANIANAQLSTGPNTPDGKTRSAANSTKLGFHAKFAVLLTEEDYQAFDALSTAFRFELHPTGPIERAFHGQIVLAAWNIERANRLEADLATTTGVDPLLSDPTEKTLNRIASYRMRAERTFHKCLKELQAYQAAHPLDEPILQNEPKPKNEPKLIEFAFKREPYVRSQPKVGRNEQCPCHSGRKYKNCCLRNEPNHTIQAKPPVAQAPQTSTATL